MGEKWLDGVQRKLLSNRVTDGMDELISGLTERRHGLSKGEWTSFVQSQLITHPVCKLVHLDPFTYRAYTKPRGYAGDGVMVDLLYRHRSCDLEGTTELGKGIYAYTSNATAPRAVRSRRDYIAKLIDETALRVEKPRVLALACGHLRELEMSVAATEGRVGECVAVDHDPQNLEVINRDYKEMGVRTIQGPFGTVFREPLASEKYDLIYTAGLFDYLPTKVAQSLTGKLFEMLLDNGKLFLANYQTNIVDVGYMESYMGWVLVYRSEGDMLELTKLIPAHRIADLKLFLENEKTIWFMTIQREESATAY